ncbi:alkaline phosphatase [Cellulomonas sp. P22]|uniref:alkaline phosphatase n=1 Tax=Cellulomonas sp. P22 TaxID=3373189 RepID=UPI00379EBDE9
MPRALTRSRRRTAVVAAVALTTLTALAGPAVAGQHGGGGWGDAFRRHGDAEQSVRSQLGATRAKNVILLIGDGMGDSEITIARDYEYGAAGELPGIDALPMTGQYTTYSLYKDGALRGKPDYVPDSAATGTAWATGVKTYDNAISVDIDGKPQQTLLEAAKAAGLKTGDVSTAEIQDATPAVQVAHISQRSCYGPVRTSATCTAEALENGGLGSISEQLLTTRPDVTLGGGAATFDETATAGTYQGRTLWQQATERGYQVVRTAADLAAVTKADQKSPVLGLFTPGNFPTRWSATPATVGGASAAPVRCTENPERLDPALSLRALTEKAIALLDTRGSKGFFLQVEGASIDKQDHAANACGQIGETIDLDEAVQAALAFAAKDKNTLVVVTADHAHSSQIVDSTPPGLSIALTTNEGSPLKISYGTAAAGGSQQHTGSQLRIAASGPGSAKVLGLTDQTDLNSTVLSALGLKRSPR